MAHTSRRQSSAKGTGNYLPESPVALIALHQQIRPGKDILGRLLTDESMRPAWKALSKRIKHDHEWQRLWGEIVHALRLSKLDRPELKRRCKAGKAIAATAGRLANSIENEPLDLMAYELFSNQVMQINGIDGWESMDSLHRSDRAHRLLREWPTVSEFLRELASRAEQFARDVMSTVPVERTTRARKAIIFSRWMTSYFKRQFNQPLHDTVAAIAMVVLSLPVTPNFVEQVTSSRRWNKRK